MELHHQEVRNVMYYVCIQKVQRLYYVDQGGDLHQSCWISISNGREEKKQWLIR